MLIPLSTDRPLRRPTLVTYAIIAANVAVFVVQTYLKLDDPDSPRANAMVQWGAISRHGFRWYQLITANFVHAGAWHILFNMLFLFVFGPNIEDRLGRIGFLLFYFLGGAAALGLHVALDHHPAIGASGAVAACTGAYFVMFPRTHVRVFSFWSLSFVWVPAWWIIGLAMIYDVLAGSVGAGTGVAHMAHIGGYVFGAGVSFALLGLKLIPGEPYDLMFQTKQAYRMSQIRSAERSFEKRVQTQLAPEKSARQGETDALALARAEVTRMIAAADFRAAREKYKTLANTFGHMPQATALSRNAQYDLGAWLYEQQDFPSAAYVFERFLEAYPTDSESPQIRLLLGRINARHLNDPIRAKLLLKEAMKGLRDESAMRLARTELEGLG